MNDNSLWQKDKYIHLVYQFDICLLPYSCYP